MKITRLLILATIAFATTARAASVTDYDSVISLATNATKNYTFTDPSSGQSVTIAVTMTPYSASNASPVFTLLDGNIDMGIDSGQGGGDGNWINLWEGVNFSASLISASSGVSASSVQFGIVGIGLRSDVGFPTNTWTSSATTTSSFLPVDDNFYVLDFAQASLSGSNYFGYLRSSISLDGQLYQLNDGDTLAGASIEFIATFTVNNSVATDPRINCWLTTYAGKYARIYTNDAMKAAGNTLTNWTNGSQTQSLPAYSGVQEIYSSTNWIYVRSTGLAAYIMGPWQHGNFPNLPVNQKLLYRFPRTNGVPATKSLNGGGQIGIFVDGVEMYNSWDAYTWSTVSNVDAQNITGYWNRDAYINEGVSFDSGYAHQQNTGAYHYHADPIGLRYLLGDHVDFNSTTKNYSENTNTPTKHSPILGWTGDGFPIYGPYGYSNATNANSGIRRMISGYVLGSTQAGGRKYLPQWAVRLYSNTSSNQIGAPYTGIHTNGCYMEDNNYLGDLFNSNTGTNYQQGVDFDLDEYNGRFCVTPEFPGGTYAYFVAITSNGLPQFPYNIGRGFYGNPVGGSVTAITETVATNFLGYTNLVSTIATPTIQNNNVTLTWSAIEGGSYQVESTTNLAGSWTIVSTGKTPAPNQITVTNSISTTAPQNFYRVGRTSVANFDSAGTTIFAIAANSPGGSASRGQNVVLTITLPNSPPNPPAGAPISSVTIGSITASSVTSIATNLVQAVFSIPINSATGAQNVVVTFNPMPTYTLSGGFTIN